MRGIEKRFDAVVALKGASLEVKPGEIHALLGSNGSGKSTMIKVLAGLVNPNGGSILFDGKPVQIGSGWDSRRLGVATAYQDLSLVPTMTVLDNIMLGNEGGGKLGIVDRKQQLLQVRALLERFHIDCHPDVFVQTLMPSTQSMLEVAKAVALKPRLLLCDEVTAALHHDEIEVLFQVLGELRDQGTAIVYVTHRMNEIFQICDRATIMRSGETVATGSIKDLSLDDIVFYMTGQRPDAQKSAEPETHAAKADRELVVEVQNLAIAPKVKNISFKAHKGEIVGIGGLEGQGQPEFIRSLLGVLPHEQGAIRYLGQEIHYRSPAEAVKNGMGFISGERNSEAIFPLRSVAENIFAGRAAKGSLFAYLSAPAVGKFAQEAVDTYSIKVGSLRHPANSLSGGNQQKLVVARWLAMKPNLLLLDDPTKGVDIHSRQEIHSILRACADEGMTVVISSSESEELLDLADTVYVFYEGQVSGVLEGESKTAEKLVAAMMGLTIEGAVPGPDSDPAPPQQQTESTEPPAVSEKEGEDA